MAGSVAKAISDVATAVTNSLNVSKDSVDSTFNGKLGRELNNGNKSFTQAVADGNATLTEGIAHTNTDTMDGIRSIQNGKGATELRNLGDKISGKAARDNAQTESNAALAKQAADEAAQLLYDKQTEAQKRMTASRARQSSLNTGMGRSSTILTSPSGSSSLGINNSSGKTLLGS